MATETFERLYRLIVDANQANTQLKKISKSTKNIETGLNGMRRAATTAFAVIGAFRSITGLVKASDQIQLLEGSFKALTGSGERAADMLQRVFDTVEGTGASIDDVSTTFQRLTVGLEELGATNVQIETIANTFIKLGRVSGTSMFDTNAALVQFSQGLASGKLQGDELRSIMERLPLITKLIQEEWNRVNEGMEITRGQVKQLGRDGELSAQLIANALLNGAKLTEEQFKQLTFTLEQEQNKLLSSLRRALAELSIVSGFDDAVKDSVRALSNTIDDLRENLRLTVDLWNEAVDAGIGFKLALSGLAGTITFLLIPAFTKLGLALAAHPLILLGTLFAGAVILFIKHADDLSLYIKYRLPEAFYAASASVFGALAFMSIKVQEGFRAVGKWVEDGVNGIIEGINEAQVALFVLSKGKIKIDLIDTVSFIETGEIVSGFTEDMEAAALMSTIFANMLGREMSKAGDSIKTLNDLGVVDPFEKLDTSEFDKRWEALVKLNAEWDKFGETIKDLLDPSRVLERKFDDIDEAVRRLNITFAEGVAAKKYFQDLYDNANKVDVKLTGLFADLSKAGNSFIEGFSTGLTDSLLNAENSFKDFATAILKDLARMILRAIFFNAIMSGLSDTKFGDFLGIPSKTSGDGEGVGILTTTGTTNAVGVLKPRTYGFGGLAGAGVGGYGDITINNNADTEVSVNQNRNNKGGMDLDILIEEKVNQSLNRGGLDKTLQSNFGIARRGF